MFYFERFITALFTPLPVIFILLFIGLLFLFFSKKLFTAKILLFSGILIFLFISMTPIPEILIEPLENDYKPYNSIYSQLKSDILNSGRSVKWIVVLAGGISEDDNLPLSSKLSTSTLTRLIEGIRIHRKFPNSKLILSGGGPKDGKVKEADLMKQLSIDLGVEPDDIIIEKRSTETAQEVEEIKKIVYNKAFILITSASHMPRAVAMFKKKSMHPMPLATDFTIKNSISNNYEKYLPNSYGFRIAERGFYEFWAKIGAMIKGQI